jgi:putative heme-binding domain-containing protein
MNVSLRHGWLVVVALPALLSACAAPGDPLAGTTPPGVPEGRRWIWADGDEVDGSRCWFWHAFQYDGPVDEARLFATCDNRMEVFLNGDSVVASDTWDHPVQIDVTGAVRAGRNVIGVRGENGSGPAGLVLELAITSGEDTVRVVTNETWVVTTEAPIGADWMTVDSSSPGRRRSFDLGGYGVEPWGDLGEGSAPEPSVALAADEIELPAGFTAERLLSVPKTTQGSWVSLCPDDRGRLYASDQYGGLFRITPPPLPTPAGSSAEALTRVEPVDIALGEAHGLLWAFDSLYVVVNAGGTYESGLYRVRDTDGDDALDEVQLLKTFDGNGEHGPHAVHLTPDGRSLYVIAGNHTKLPADLSSSRVPELWAEDQLLPRHSDPGGHAVGIRAPGGWICRTDPEGREWELVAAGFRNAYDVDLDPSGELFTFDSDMEWDVGLPWYRPTRILHVPSGAEFGWRTGSGKWPTFYPDSLPTTVDIGLSSPTGVVFGTHTRFPEPWRSAFFAADWAYGTIHAVHLVPAGASFTGTAEPFVSGRPLPVTDLAVGRDGALYFTTGGRRAQSGLYRVAWTGAPVKAVTTGSPDETDAVRRRHALEAWHHPGGGAAAVEAAWPDLGDPDRAIRFAARVALEHQDPTLWAERALAEERLDASIEALVGLIRADTRVGSTEVAARMDRWPWETLDDATLQRALRALELALIRIPTVSVHAPEPWKGIEERLLARLPTGSDLTDRELCRVLSHLQCEGLAPKAIALLADAPSQETAIDLALILSTLRTGWNDALRARLLRWFDVDAAELSGGNSFREYLNEIRSDALESMGVSMPVDALAQVGSARPWAASQAPFVRNWTLADLEPELERLRSGRSFDAGRALFERTSCLTCHRIGGEGGSTGPDLTGAGNRFGPRDVLAALLEPSATISDQYLDTEVWTLDGDVVVGRLVESEPDHLVLKRAGDDLRVTIARADVDLERPHPLSRMPEGLLDTCTLEEVLDLMAYVLAGGDPGARAFGQ